VVAYLSFFVIGLITVALCLVITYYLRKDLLEREWRITADYIRTEARHYLTPTDFALPFSPSAQEHFQDFYKKTVRMPEIVRVKIYDPTAAVVWSDQPLLIGQRFLDNIHFLGALAGHTMVNLEMEAKGENIYERAEFPELVEVYVPIVFPEHTEVAGVVETYKAPTTGRWWWLKQPWRAAPSSIFPSSGSSAVQRGASASSNRPLRSWVRS